MSISSDKVLGKLLGVKGAGKSAWVALCPAHDDKQPSLSIREIDGQTLLYDHGGCHTVDVVASMGLEMTDLFDSPRGVTYEYRGANDQVSRTVHRSPEKRFFQDVNDDETPLYHRGEVRVAAVRGSAIYFTEGEKDADAARSVGFTATTTPGGARNWHHADFSVLQGTTSPLFIIADADEAGMTRVWEMREHLRQYTSGAVTVMLPKTEKDLADQLMRDGVISSTNFLIESSVNGRYVPEPKAYTLTRESLRDILNDDEAKEHDWVIPQLLARAERLIITGGEGAGKMVLIRQLTLLAAAGIHPFKGTHMTPIKVLVFDTENSRSQWNRSAGFIANRARDLGARDPAEHYECVLQQELDVRRPDVMSEIHRHVDEVEPDIVVLAPLYRLVPRAINDDNEAAPLLAALNTITAKGATLILEAHAGKPSSQSFSNDNSWAPRGSSAFRGWPEFGFGLAPVEHDENMVAIKRWRGDREQREWPTYLHRAVHPEDWPWNPSYQPS